MRSHEEEEDRQIASSIRTANNHLWGGQNETGAASAGPPSRFERLTIEGPGFAGGSLLL